MNLMARVAAFALILGSTSVAWAETLQNDGFTAGMAVHYQGGFVAGEAAAVELTPGAGSWKVDKVRFFYGTNTTTHMISVTIYAASANATPGAVLYTGDFNVTGSANAMVEVDLTAENIIVNSAFRVGLGFSHAGSPSIARDDDGTVNKPKNFYYIDYTGDGHAWYETNSTDILPLIHVPGDWVIRADVTSQGGGGTPDAGPNDPDANPSAPDAAPGAGGPDGGASVSCTLNSDCALGSYCGDDSTCAIDCRNDIDCTGDLSCEPAIGKCEKKSSGGGCSTGGTSPLGSSTALLVLLGLLAWRPRSRRS